MMVVQLCLHCTIEVINYSLRKGGISLRYIGLSTLDWRLWCTFQNHDDVRFKIMKWLTNAGSPAPHLQPRKERTYRILIGVVQFNTEVAQNLWNKEKERLYSQYANSYILQKRETTCRTFLFIARRNNRWSSILVMWSDQKYAKVSKELQLHFET